MGFLGNYVLPIQKLLRLYKLIEVKSKTSSFSRQTSNVDADHFASVLIRAKRRFMSVLLAFEFLVRNLIVAYHANFLGKTVLLDRSIYDQHTVYSSTIIIDFIRRIMIKPDHVLFLKGDASVFLGRKKEYELQALQLQQDMNLRYLRLRFSRRLNEIDANNSGREVLREALSVLTRNG